jgi:hypothetical protein
MDNYSFIVKESEEEQKYEELKNLKEREVDRKKHILRQKKDIEELKQQLNDMPNMEDIKFKTVLS